jgi:CheY-like chemotaxis protein
MTQPERASAQRIKLILIAPFKGLRGVDFAMASLEYLSFLIVDDTAQMRAIVSAVLRGFGARDVQEANDGAEAMAKTRGWKPDIIITDLRMDFSDGLMLTRAVRAGETPIDPHTPIILMTGHSEAFRVGDARDAGVDEFLAKPISIATLLARIASVVDRPRPFIAAGGYRGPDRRRRIVTDHEGPWRRTSDECEFDLDAFAPARAHHG